MGVVLLACVASVSIGFPARLRRFSLFGGAKIRASATLMEAALLVLFFFIQEEKIVQTCGKPYGNACYAGYCIVFKRPNRTNRTITSV